MGSTRTRHTLAVLAVVLLVTVFGTRQAGAQEPPPSAAPAQSESPGILGLGAEVGAIFPQPFTALGTHVSFGLEVGVRLPVLQHRLEVLLGAAYAPPGNAFDDGPYHGEIMEQELTFSLGPRYRFLPVRADWNVTAGLGFRLFLLQSRSNGSAEGEPFAEFRERSTEPGFFVVLGGERRVGPGALLLDLDLGVSALPHRISGDTTSANLALTIGYRLVL